MARLGAHMSISGGVDTAFDRGEQVGFTSARSRTSDIYSSYCSFLDEHNRASGRSACVCEMTYLYAREFC